MTIDVKIDYNSDEEPPPPLCLLPALHSVAKVYAVLPFYDVKCLCSGGREWGREESHSH